MKLKYKQNADKPALFLSNTNRMIFIKSVHNGSRRRGTIVYVKISNVGGMINSFINRRPHKMLISLLIFVTLNLVSTRKFGINHKRINKFPGEIIFTINILCRYNIWWCKIQCNSDSNCLFKAFPSDFSKMSQMFWMCVFDGASPCFSTNVLALDTKLSINSMFRSFRETPKNSPSLVMFK